MYSAHSALVDGERHRDELVTYLEAFNSLPRFKHA